MVRTATLSNYTAPPSARSIRAGAGSTVQQGTQDNRPAYKSMYGQENLPQADMNAVRQTIMKQHPELFKTESQVREEATKNGRAIGLSGSKLARYVSTEWNHYETSGSRQEQINDYIDKEYRYQQTVVYNNEQEKTNDQRRAEARTRDEIIASGGTKNAVSTAAAPTNRASNITKDQARALNSAEASLMSQVIQNPEMESHFQQVTDYFKQLSDLDPDERKKMLEDLQSEANSLVDEPFEARKRVVKDRLTMKVRQLQQTFGTLSDGEAMKLEQTIQELDNDAVSALDKDLGDLIQRGGLNSGLFRRIADRIVEVRERGAGDATRVRDFNVRSARERLDQNKESLGFEAENDLAGIEQEQTAERSTMFSDLLGDKVQTGLLADLISGAGEYSDTAIPGPAKPTAATLRATLPTIAAPAGSSLDLARKAASGEITPEQQRAAREKLMYPNGVPAAPTTTNVRTTPVTQPAAPTKPLAPTTPVSTLRTSAPQTYTSARLPGTTVTRPSTRR